MAPEAGQHPQSPELLFVHKFADSTSLSHSQRLEKRSIASHVQNWRKKQKAKTAITRPVKFPHQLISKPQGEQNRSSPKTLASPLLDSAKSLEPNVAASPLNLDLGATANTQAISLNPPGGAIDPFATSPIKLDSQTHTLLQYYLRVIHPSRFHAETRARGAQNHYFYLASNGIIRACLDNELHMITLLTSTASRMQHMEQLPVRGGTDVYMHRALKALRNYVADTPVASTQLVFDMFHLFTAEAYRFNNAGAKIHLKAAKAVVEQMGGQAALQRANPHLIETLAIGDLFVAAEDLSPPILSCTFDPGFGTARHLCLDTSAFRTQMGVRLLNPMHGAIVSPQSYQVVKEVIECVKVALCTSDMRDPPSKALRWLHLRNLAIRHYLLSIAVEDPRTAALHTVLQMWILMAFTRMGSVRTTKVMAPKLKELLAKITWRNWIGHEDIYAWILSIGAMAARETPSEIWFVQQMVRLPQCNELTSMERLRHFSEQFFYLDSIQSSWLEPLAAQLTLANSPALYEDIAG